MLRRLIKKILTPPMIVVAALVMFFEEWLWERLTAIMAAIGRLALVASLERKLATLSPYAAMAFFLVPVLLILPVKLVALYFVTQGHVISGITVIILAKVVGTAVAARLFTLFKPALLTLGWFARFHGALFRFKESLYARVRALPAWQATLDWKHRMGARIRHFTRNWKGGMLKRRWQAIRLRQKQ